MDSFKQPNLQTFIMDITDIMDGLKEHNGPTYIIDGFEQQSWHVYSGGFKQPNGQTNIMDSLKAPNGLASIMDGFKQSKWQTDVMDG